MRTKNSNKQFAVIALAGLAVLAWCFGRAVSGKAAAQQPKAESSETFKFMGAENCRRCHTVPAGADKPDLVRLTEYTTWRTEDKHSLAYAVLEGPRGQKMGELLANNKEYVLKPEAGCLGCHSMHFPDRVGNEFDPKEGVSCDGCHGPSEKWLGPHFADKPTWRAKSPQDKAALGMRDLRDPATKAKLCTSCHVGSVEEGKIVTHAMYAAGHPPLPGFELATFCKNLPQHWMDLKEVPFLKTAKDDIKKLYHFDTADFQNTLAALVGSGATLREQLHLVGSRANFAGENGKRRWPELSLPAFAEEMNPEEIWPQVAMAHSDCYACHHDLRRMSWRQERGYGLRLLDGGFVEGIPGKPQLRLWPIDLFEISFRQAAKDDSDAKRLVSELKGGLDKLYGALNTRPFGEPRDVRQASEQLRDWCAKVVEDRLAPLRLDKTAQLRLLHTLCRQPEGYYPDFDTARQIASAFQMIYGEWVSRNGEKQANEQAVREVLENLNRQLGLWAVSGYQSSSAARKQLIREQVEKSAGKKPATEKEFQEALRDLDKDKLKAALLDKDLLAAVQQIRDKDFVESSQAAANYDPLLFRKRLAELSRLLSK